MRALFIGFLLLLSTLSTFAQKGDDEIKKHITLLSAEFTGYVNDDNLGKIASFFTADAAIIAPNVEKVDGRVAVRNYYTGIKDSQSNVLTELKKIEVVNDAFAIEHGNYSMVLTKAGGTPFLDKGSYIIAWKKENDGKWRIHLYTYNSELNLN
jgi:uncharacterized protein (TIGR02246 family)